MVQKIRLGEIQWKQEKMILDFFPANAVCRNLRDVLDKESWDFVRKSAYTFDGRRCRHCGERRGGEVVYVVPVWDFTDESVNGYYVQRLVKLLTVCPKCLAIKRFWTSQEEALPIVSESWGVSDEEVIAVVMQKAEEVEMMRDRLWVLDLSAIENEHFRLGLRNSGTRILRNGMIEGVT